MMNIRSIAQLANVSPSTVSKALNGRSDVAPETRKKILEIVKTHQFSRNSFGQGLKMRLTQNIGLIFSRDQHALSDNPFYSKVLEGVEAELSFNNYNLLLNIIQASQTGLPKMVREKHVDGVILIGVFHDDFLERILSENLPVIMIDPQNIVEAFAQIHIDNEYGGFLATQYLIRAGHDKIGFVSGDLKRMSFKQRLDGYLKALHYYHIEVDERLIRTGGLENGYQHFKSILSDQNPTAIFAANDINAIRGYKAVHEMKLRIPDDISVVGFDDIDLASIAAPPLTTVRVHKREFGSIAVRTLLKMIREDNAQKPVVMIPTHLIERESVRNLKNDNSGNVPPGS
jgi:LacI family transcriptional regulator